MYKNEKNDVSDESLCTGVRAWCVVLWFHPSQVTVNSSSESCSQESNSNVNNFNVAASQAWFPLNRNNCVFILGIHLYHYNLKVVVQSAKLYQVDG